MFLTAVIKMDLAILPDCQNGVLRKGCIKCYCLVLFCVWWERVLYAKSLILPKQCINALRALSLTAVEYFRDFTVFLCIHQRAALHFLHTKVSLKKINLLPNCFCHQLRSKITSKEIGGWWLIISLHWNLALIKINFHQVSLKRWLIKLF